MRLTLLEVGAGTGQDSAFFTGAGLDVTATDLSPAMIERVRAKGLRGLIRDVRDLNFPTNRSTRSTPSTCCSMCRTLTSRPSRPGSERC